MGGRDSGVEGSAPVQRKAERLYNFWTPSTPYVCVSRFLTNTKHQTTTKNRHAHRSKLARLHGLTGLSPLQHHPAASAGTSAPPPVFPSRRARLAQEAFVTRSQRAPHGGRGLRPRLLSRRTPCDTAVAIALALGRERRRQGGGGRGGRWGGRGGVNRKNR